MRHQEDRSAERINRSAFRWNATAGMVMAFQSVVMLVVITRVCDVLAAGVFTIAYANANLFLYLGKYGMKQFQVSDRTGQFSFWDYRKSRILTDIAMMVTSSAYLVYASITLSYSMDKTLVMLLMCLFKLVDSSEDVFMGNYQQMGRLDVGARVMSVRLITTIALFAASVVVFQALLPALAVATAYTFAFYLAELRFIRKKYDLPQELEGGDACSKEHDWKDVWKLLKACFPLFAASFMLFYIGNAPKYAIDALMDDAAQAYYGYISMPVFIVNMLAWFIYNPMIASLSDQWRNRDIKLFIKRFIRLAGVIACVTAVCVLAAWIAGVPVLNILYNADTSPYLFELVILVFGGGFLALITLAVLGMTIIRFQQLLVPIYAVASVLAGVASFVVVADFGITGAAWVYLATMVVLAAVFLVCFAVGIRLKSKE